MKHLSRAERSVLTALLDPGLPPSAATWNEPLRWPVLIAAADQAKLLPALALRAPQHGQHAPDADQHAQLRDALHETAVHNTRILAELARAVSILRAADIACVALKGAVLLTRNYRQLALRHTVDLDLLIDPLRFDDAIAALRAAGYVDDPLFAAMLVGDGSSVAQAWPAAAHTCPPLKAPSGVSVDLHRRVPVSGFELSGGFAGWLARARPELVQGVSVAMCSHTDLAVHLCEHFALQHHADPTDAPRLLCDLRAMFPEAPPWHELQQGSTLQQRIAVHVAKQLYEAAFERTGARDPLTRLLRRVAIADVSVITALAQLSHLRGHATRFSFNVRNRPSYALRSVLPTRAYMAQHYGVDPHSLRIYPLYLLRLLETPLRPLWRSR